MRLRSFRIGLDLDGISEFNTLKSYFNAKHFFRDKMVFIMRTGRGFHIRIYCDNPDIMDNLNVRRNLADDVQRLAYDEARVPIPELHDHFDSIPGYVPVYCKIDEKVVILSFEDLWNRIEVPINNVPTGEELKITDNLHTLHHKNTGWVKVKAISRHYYDGEIIQIVTNGGLIDATPNHSVFAGKAGYEARPIAASKLKINDDLEVRPLVWYGDDKCRIGVKSPFFIGNKDLAWFYGLFAAEGTAYSGRSCGRSINRIVIANKKKEIMEKAEKVMVESLHASPYWNHRDDCDQLVFGSRSLATLFYNMFYTADRKKKIPDEVLNAPAEVQQAFLEGYIAGDGDHDYKGRLCGFTTNSQVLAAGLIYLLTHVGRLKKHHVYVRNDKPNVVTIRWTVTTNESSLSPRSIKKIRKSHFQGYVYDLTTNSGRFCAGIGPVVAHNTIFQSKRWADRRSKTKREEIYYPLARPYWSKLPCRKFWKRHKKSSRGVK